jgi:hypothetical protein
VVVDMLPAPGARLLAADTAPLDALVAAAPDVGGPAAQPGSWVQTGQWLLYGGHYRVWTLPAGDTPPTWRALCALLATADLVDVRPRLGRAFPHPDPSYGYAGSGFYATELRLRSQHAGAAAAAKAALEDLAQVLADITRRPANVVA